MEGNPKIMKNKIPNKINLFELHFHSLKIRCIRTFLRVKGSTNEIKGNLLLLSINSARVLLSLVEGEKKQVFCIFPSLTLLKFRRKEDDPKCRFLKG